MEAIPRVLADDLELNVFGPHHTELLLTAVSFTIDYIHGIGGKLSHGSRMFSLRMWLSVKGYDGCHGGNFAGPSWLFSIAGGTWALTPLFHINWLHLRSRRGFMPGPLWLLK